MDVLPHPRVAWHLGLSSVGILIAVLECSANLVLVPLNMH